MTPPPTSLALPVWTGAREARQIAAMLDGMASLWERTG